MCTGFNLVISGFQLLAVAGHIADEKLSGGFHSAAVARFRICCSVERVFLAANTCWDSWISRTPFTRYKRLSNRFDNRLYRVNGASVILWIDFHWRLSFWQGDWHRDTVYRACEQEAVLLIACISLVTWRNERWFNCVSFGLSFDEATHHLTGKTWFPCLLFYRLVPKY